MNDTSFLNTFKKALSKTLKSDLTYALIFFSLYLFFFINLTAMIFFIVAFIQTFFTVKTYKTLEKWAFLFIFIYLIPLTLGFYFYNTFALVGFLLGSATAAFLMSCFSFYLSPTKKSNGKLLQINTVILISQICFSFYYFYNLVIQDIRGQNNLDHQFIFITTFAFIFIAILFQIIFKKLLTSRLDRITYFNFIYITFVALAFFTFYFAFIEVGTLNVILPVAFAGFTFIFIAAYILLKNTKGFKLKTTLSSIFYFFIPGLLLLFYPWNISRYLGLLYSSIAAAIFLPSFFYEINEKIKFRFNTYASVLINLTILILSFFTLSTRGLITRLNIANVDYFFALLLGIFSLMFIKDVLYSLKNYLVRNSLVGAFSVSFFTLYAFILFVFLEIGGIETLGTYLFGVIAYSFVKNIFSFRNKTKSSLEQLNGTLENIIINSLVVIATALLLIKL